MVMTAKTKMFTMVLITKTDNGNDDYMAITMALIMTKGIMMS